MIIDKIVLGLFILDILAWHPQFHKRGRNIRMPRLLLKRQSIERPSNISKRSLPLRPSVAVVQSNVVAVNVVAPNLVISSNPIF